MADSFGSLCYTEITVKRDIMVSMKVFNVTLTAGW